MFKPDDALKPRDEAFTEAWHAQTLAIAESMVNAELITANDWAQALGAALKSADQSGEPDTTDTYYHAALKALEVLTVRSTPLSENDLTNRKSDWTDAYLATPHGHPVQLGK